MWSEQRITHNFFSPRVLYCNSSSSGCQGPLKIKITTQNLIRSKQRKRPRLDHLHHQGANPSAHTWWRWSHFAFRRIKTPVRTQKLICSKQRKGDYCNFNRHGSRYIGTYVSKLKHGFANFEKIKSSLKKLSLNACNLLKKVIQW